MKARNGIPVRIVRIVALDEKTQGQVASDPLAAFREADGADLIDESEWPGGVCNGNPSVNRENVNHVIDSIMALTPPAEGADYAERVRVPGRILS
jgi:hypothetical protein